MSQISENVLNALFEFLDLTTEKQIDEFKQNVKEGKIDLVGYIENYDLSDVRSGNFLKLRRTLRSIDGKSIESEGPLTKATYLWLLDVANVSSSEEQKADSLNGKGQDSAYGSESPLVKEEAAKSLNQSSKEFEVYLHPSLRKEDSVESPIKQAPVKEELLRDISTASKGGPQNWESLGKLSH